MASFYKIKNFKVNLSDLFLCTLSWKFFLQSLDYITADGDEPYTPPGLSDDDDDIADPGSKTPVYGGQNIAGEQQQPTPVKDASVPGLEFNIDPTKSFFDTSAKPTKESKKSPEKSVKTPQTPAEPAKQFGLKIRSMASLQEVKKEAIEDLPVITIHCSFLLITKTKFDNSALLQERQSFWIWNSWFYYFLFYFLYLFICREPL